MITTKDLKIVSLAKKMLNLSTHPRYHMVAVISKGGRVISVGINKVSAAKRFTKQRPGMHLHAEIDALTNLSKEQTKGCTITLVGTTAAGNNMVTKPCNICQDFIEYMNIRRIVYMDKDEVKELK